MGDMKSPLNTFSDSAKKNDSIANNQPQAIDNHILKPAPPQPKQEFTISPHIVAMLEKMTKMQNEIDEKIESAIRQHGITKPQLDAYLNDPKNFSPDQLDFLKKTRYEMVKKVIAATNIPDIEVEDISQSSSAKRGKVKSIGARRNWIPTR